MNLLFFFSIFSLSYLFGSPGKDGVWVDLLDNKLSRWDMYLSYRHRPGYDGKPPRDEKGAIVKPVGFNNNEAGVFTVKEEGGATILRVSGEIYGGLISKEEYENYHLKLQVKWGHRKWEPRLDEPMDSGLLYHSQGEPGVDYWRSWMLSQEFQIMEQGFGDYWCIAQSGAMIKMADPESRRDMGIFDVNGTLTRMGAGGNRTGFVRHNENHEKPFGDWNTIELICFNGKSIHIVNGHVVMALSESYFKDGNVYKPLNKGKLQLQSEAAEVFFKEILIRNISSVPQQYAQHFK